MTNTAWTLARLTVLAVGHPTLWILERVWRIEVRG